MEALLTCDLMLEAPSCFYSSPHRAAEMMTAWRAGEVAQAVANEFVPAGASSPGFGVGDCLHWLGHRMLWLHVAAVNRPVSTTDLKAGLT